MKHKHKTSDIIDVHNEMDYTIEKEFYRYIPGFLGYRVSNYANKKNDKKDIYITSQIQGGYYRIDLRCNKNKYKNCVHKVIALVFNRKSTSEKHTVEP